MQMVLYSVFVDFLRSFTSFHFSAVYMEQGTNDAPHHGIHGIMARGILEGNKGKRNELAPFPGKARHGVAVAYTPANV
jgi:hypothetical protein